MKLIKNTYGKVFLEADAVTIHKDFFGRFKSATVMLDLDKLLKDTPSPVLEDLFHLINSELLERDHAWVEKNL